MTVALGTSTPTSMTVVATSTSILPAAKALIVASFSAAGIWPCSGATRRSDRCPAASPGAAFSTAIAVPSSAAETFGHTTYACLPAATSSRTRSHARVSQRG